VDLGGVLPVTTPLFPTAPTGLTATVVSGSEVDLTWSDTAGDESGFVVYESNDGGSDWEQVGQVGPTTFSYSDTNVLDDTSYEFEIAAMNSAGNLSAFDVAAQPVTTPLNAPTGLAYDVSYTSEGASGYPDEIPVSPDYPLVSLTWNTDSAAAVTTNLQVSDYSNFSSYGAVPLPATQESFLLGSTASSGILPILSEAYPPEEQGGYVLYPGTYYVRLQSLDGAGSVSPWSSTFTITVPELPPELPASVEMEWTVGTSYNIYYNLYTGGDGDPAPTYESYLASGFPDWPDDSTQEFALTSQTTHGALSFVPPQGVRYTPEEGYTGEDRFTYIVIDPNTGAQSTPCTVEIEDYGDDSPEIASPIEFYGPEGNASQDPAVLTIPTDNLFYDEDSTGTLDDMDYNTSLIAAGQQVPVGFDDNKFAVISLGNYWIYPVQIEASDWASIRIFNSAGVYYSPSELSEGVTASQSNSDLYIEGVEANPDLQLTVTLDASFELLPSS
jgi:hypothetical protein